MPSSLQTHGGSKPRFIFSHRSYRRLQTDDWNTDDPPRSTEPGGKQYDCGPAAIIVSPAIKDASSTERYVFPFSQHIARVASKRASLEGDGSVQQGSVMWI